MAYFDRKIKYLDYVEYGNKIRNGGFVKAEVRDGECRVQVNVRGLYPTDTLQGELFLYSRGTEYKADTIMLHFGTGIYAVKWKADNLAGLGIAYEDWDGVSIRVSEHRVLQNIWREREREPEPEPVAEVLVEVEPEPEQITKAQRAVQPEMQTQPKVKTEPESQSQSVSVGELVAESSPVPELQPETQNATPESIPTQERFQTLYEDKWTQLGQFYKTVHPFGDKRGYLSLTPRDFVVLSERFQKLVSNSFLLHGYYNYGHILLGRQEEHGDNAYYLGVPGIYHEREKQVARMFGFEAFEGAKSPYAEGSFGYYMIGVEL